MPTRVLIAEDEAILAMALRSGLESQGYMVVGIAPTGTEALDLARAQSPDVVLMDIRMPSMDGIEVTRRLMTQHPVCVVIVSGNAQPSKIAEATEAGAMNYVTKPFLASQMPSVLEAARGRFECFMAIRREASDTDEAMRKWGLVVSAARLLMEREQVCQAEACALLKRRACERGLSLHAAAQQVIDSGPGEPDC